MFCGIESTKFYCQPWFGIIVFIVLLIAISVLANANQEKTKYSRSKFIKEKIKVLFDEVHRGTTYGNTNIKKINIIETGAEALKRFSIENGTRLPVSHITSLQIDYSVDVQVQIGKFWFIAVFDIDHKPNTHRIADKDTIQICFSQEFLKNPIGEIKETDQIDRLFVERVILNPKHIESMILESRTALSY